MLSSAEHEKSLITSGPGFLALPAKVHVASLEISDIKLQVLHCQGVTKALLRLCICAE